MRIRSLKPDYFTDRITGRWPFDMQVFYAALWCYADDEGRFEWEPEAIRGQLFPYQKDVDAAGLLERIAATGRIQRYEVDGVSYGVIPKFKKHQKPNKPVPSRLPAPDGSATGERTEDERSPTVVLPAVEERRVEDGSVSPAGVTPQGLALDHWHEKVWANISPHRPKPTVVAMTMLARRCREHGLEVVKAAMDGLLVRLSSDKWLRDNITLQNFLSDAQFPKFLPRGQVVHLKPKSARSHYDEARGCWILKDGTMDPTDTIPPAEAK